VVRKLVAYELLSLDGVAEDPDTFITSWDDAMDENLARVIATQDTVILGRRTYNDWADFWPTSDIQPFADFINPVEKVVVTSTPPENTWTNATVLGGGLLDSVAALKERSGGDIGLHGSIALTQALLEGGLVDELSLVIAPALQGKGRKLFEKGLSTSLTLTGHVISPSGYLLLDYRVQPNS
jgi:dihydrofolate reductase